MKRVDITEKLKFEEKPVLIVKGEEIEVNNDAMTVLQIMNMAGSGDDPKQLVKALDLLFTQEGIKKINAMKLSFTDLSTVIEAAMDLAIGEDEEPGELETAPEQEESASTTYSLTGI